MCKQAHTDRSNENGSRERESFSGDSPLRINRWRALVEVVDLLVNADRPGLAFASVCVLVLPFASITAALILYSHFSTVKGEVRSKSVAHENFEPNATAPKRCSSSINSLCPTHPGL